MESQTRILERYIIEGKVFKGGATWKKLEKFFGKSQEVILEELSTVATAEDIKYIVDQINANQHYLENVRIIDPTCLRNKDDLRAFLTLNSKLYSISGAEDTEVGKDLMELNYLKIFDSSEKNLGPRKYDSDTMTEKEIELFRVCEHFKMYGKKVLLLTSDEETVRKAAAYDINAATFDYFEK